MAILDQFGTPIVQPQAQRRHYRNLLARYDSAQTVTENMRQWSNTDSYSADAANSLEVRKKLRERSRYEVANNSYCRSMVDTVAADVIGTGPRLQLRTGDRDADKAIEREFTRWAAAIGFAKKLRTMRKSRTVDGETFALFTFNDRLQTPVQLDFRPIECDRITDPYPKLDANNIDGVRIDGNDVPIAYHVLDYHPGDIGSFGAYGLNGQWVDAGRIVHMFRQDRPEQHRGIPDLTPALRLFSQLRRYTLAVLAAAETAADFAAVIQTNQPVDAGYNVNGTETSVAAPEPMDTFELSQRLVTVLPDGYSLGQVKAEQPTTTYGEFKREILAEAFAAMCMPFNVGAHDSSEFNFASGKLDRLGYARLAAIDQSEWEAECLNRTMLAWAQWAMVIPGYLPVDGLPPINQWAIGWYWDELDDIDPQKAALATETCLKTFQTTIPRVWAQQGRDWEVEMESQAEALGMTVPEYRKRLANSLLGPEQQQPQPQGAGNANSQADKQPVASDSDAE